MNRFGHVDIRVTDLAQALPFYLALTTALGYRREYHGPEWKVFAADGELPQAPYLALTEGANHRPNANRIAFWAPSTQEVDAVAAAVSGAGAGHVDGPAYVPEFGTSYYAVFFEDPCGNRFEVYYRVMPTP